MNTRGRSGKDDRTVRTEPRGFRLAPVAQAIALIVAASGIVGNVHAASAFSPSWFAAKGAMQDTARTTGLLPNGKPVSSLNPLAQQQQANAQLQKSINNLNLAARAIAAQQAAQAAATNNDPSVPDGLADGGLKVDTNSLTAGWINAQNAKQTVSDGKTTVEIQQTADKAILNWETFNVGKNTTVQFDQQADWAVLNRVDDPMARPSQIQGQIKADGTVLIVNRNGIVFSGSSQVNARNLAAAAASMSDSQFNTNGIYSTQAGGTYQPAFTDANGALIVQAGAQIVTATSISATQGGGYALLLGKEVTNAGSIVTPGGQAQLAAGDFFIVRPGQGTAANQFSTTRGNEVAPQFNAGGTDSTGGASGNVTNTGLLVATEGDVTLAGRHVVQDGVALATTSVDTRGTIHLLTSASDAQSSVTTTGRAVTAILLDDKGDTALDSQRNALITQSTQMDALRRATTLGVFDNLSTQDDREDLSRIEIVSGGNVSFAGGSTTLATGGQLAVSAGAGTGRTTVASGATLDVSGSVGVNVAMESNNVLVNIQGNEQRDAPINRDTTNLNSSNVWIDRRQLVFVPAGTGGDDTDRWYTAGGLLEVSGYLGLAGHSVGEWAAQGGSIAFTGGEVVTQGGSNINLSGGSLNVQTGMIRDTWLKGPDGQLYEINHAPGDIAYTGVYKGFEDTHARWGAATTSFYMSPLITPQMRLENGYTVGRDAGTLIVATGSAVLEGDMTADVYQGPRQVQKSNAGLDGYNQSQTAAAQGAQLVLGSYTSVTDTTPPNGPVTISRNLTPTFNEIVLTDDYAAVADSLQDGEALPQANKDTFYLDSNKFNAWGFGSIIAVANNRVTVDGALAVTSGGAIDLYAPQVMVNANLTARGGNIALGNVMTAFIPNSGAAFDNTLPGKDAQVTIAKGLTLDARGIWSNLQLDPADVSGLPYVDGGAVSIRSTGGVLLDEGSLIDVSSGAALMPDGSLKGGKGGDVTLASSTVISSGALLQLRGEVRAYGVTGGGTLTIESGSAIGIDGLPLDVNGVLQAGESSTVNLRLGQDYVVAIGEKIPFDFSVTVSILAPGQVATTITKPAFTDFAPTGVDWVVPANVSFAQQSGNHHQYFPGDLVPAGTILEFLGWQTGFVVPADVFPEGIPITPIVTPYTAGTVVTAPTVIPAGTLIEAGDRFPQRVTVGPVVVLDSSLFRSGFSQYTVNGHDGVAVADGATVNVSMPVYEWNDTGTSLQTGADPAQALQLWTPPVHQEDAVHGVLTQRGGASLSLLAGAPTDTSTATAPLYVGKNATITVDPGSAIALQGDGGQVTIDGVLNAWGGSIRIASAPPASAFDHNDPNRSLWIGDAAVLDAAARAYVAYDNEGRVYGVAPDGGSITLGPVDAFIVIRPGAVLDASGSAAAVDLSAGRNSAVPAQPLVLAGDGGNIELHSYVGMYLDGDMRAQAGGAGAAGGSLTVDMAERLYNASFETIGANLQVMHNITLTQDDRPSGLADGLQPGQADAKMLTGQAGLSAEQIEAGGFDALTLKAHDMFIFEGDTNLSLGRSLNLQRGILTVSDATPGAQVHLSAPYILVGGGVPDPVVSPGFYIPEFQASLGTTRLGIDSGLTLSADLIDLSGGLSSGAIGRQGAGILTFVPGNIDPNAPFIPVDLAGFATLTLNSTGDIRLNGGGAGTGGDLLISAAQLYPVSGAKGSLSAGFLVDPTTGLPIAGSHNLLQIRSNGQPAPVPDSVFGQLSLNAGTVDQGGVVRAPLGTISINDSGSLTRTPSGANVILRSGSLTSVSAAGLTMPFGGTVDGLTYRGTEGTRNTDTTFYGLGSTVVDRPNADPAGGKDGAVLPVGITIGGSSLVGEPGAMLDLSGGGDLRGAGFISGRGGSVDVLTTPLVNANPALNTYSKSGDKVYAIVPGRASDYAPVIADKGAGDPAIGRQIEIGANVPGLPAGTYTLLPASYALMAGAWRVEVGAQITTAGLSTVALPGGSWVSSGTLKTANTAIRDALPTQLIFTPGATVRDTSQYNETRYADFAVAQAARFGNVRPLLPEDGKVLRLYFRQDDDAQPLQFDGVAKFSGAGDGIAGNLIVVGNASIDITGPNAAPVAGEISLTANALNSFGASTVMVGGWVSYFDGQDSDGDSARLYFTLGTGSGNALHVRDGADLKAGQIFLISPNVTVDAGATLDTRGFGAPGVDSNLGFVYANSLRVNQTSDTPAVLAVANGWIDLLAAQGTGSINVAGGANLLTEGTIAFVAPGGLSLGDANLGARYLSVSQDQINIGNADSLAAAQAAGVLPAGWQLTQDILDKLLHPSSDAGVPALERLSLTAGGAFNFFGSVTLDTGDTQAQLVLNTPAFHGWGTDSDVVRLAADTLVWNGVATGGGTVSSPYVSVTPTAVVPGGAGTGSGRLEIDANTVEFGYDALSRPQSQATLSREALGFAGVTINASDRITANSKGMLAVTGDMTLNTPLLTGEAGSVMSYSASGALTVAAPAGAAPADTRAIGTLGSTVALKGQTVTLDTAVALPSGKLTIDAVGDIALGDGAFVDLAGRGVAFFDVTKYSWGGDVALQSTTGSIRQRAGSLIDVSAANNNAGSLSLIATSGSVDLAGGLSGQGGEGYDGGHFTLQVRQLADADFSALNDKLNNSAFFGARDFTLKQGDLVVGDGVRAHEISISVDGGSLTVNGAVDASGQNVGAINLAASGDLTVAGTALLDTHGTVLVTDSDGAPIDASNRADISLTSTAGTVTLADGAHMDLRSADSIARGHVEINAERKGGADVTGDGANDIAIDAGGHLQIDGASSIAVNGFRTYKLGADDVVDQAYLDGVDTGNRNFIDAAWNNATLQSRLAGLAAYGAAYHLRPGVELDSDGDISTQGDIDLAGYRYGPNADPSQRGSGEPGVLVLRAAGNLNINGSITDGFGLPGATDDDVSGWGVLLPQGLLTAPLTVNASNVVLAAGSTLPLASSFNEDLVLTDDPNFFGQSSVTFKPGVVLPGDANVYSVFFSDTTTVTVPIVDATDGTTVLYHPGDTIPAGTNLTNVILGAGFNIGTTSITLNSVKIPAGTRLDNLFDSPFFGTDIFLTANMQLPDGVTLPANSNITYVGSNFIPSRPVGPDGTQGKMWANAPMLAPGMQSWSMRLVGGADLDSADSRALQSMASLAGGGNVVLNDPHVAGATTSAPVQALSVLRTGTGDLEIFAGGNYSQQSLFGVYSAGTAIDADDSAGYNLPRATANDAALGSYASALNDQRMWFTEQGGNVTLAAQGNITGYQDNFSMSIGDWLLREGGDEIGQKTAWGINFGSYVADMAPDGRFFFGQAGFSGIGALGGGNLDVRAGGNIGIAGNAQAGLVLAVAGSGRVVEGDGGKTLVQTGGGNVNVTAGGVVSDGLMVDLRGDITVNASGMGAIALNSYGSLFSGQDPRLLDAHISYASTNSDGVGFAPGDGTVTVNTLGDLVLGNVFDPGRVGLRIETQVDDGAHSGSAASWFTLWRDDTAINAFSAGGNVAPLGDVNTAGVNTIVMPPTLRVVAAGGSIYVAAADYNDFMMPSPQGQLELLANGLVSGDLDNSIAGSSPFGPLGTSQSAMATPMHAAWRVTGDTGTQTSNYWDNATKPTDLLTPYDYAYNSDRQEYQGHGGILFMFGPDTVTDDSAAGSGMLSRVYAVNGDIIGLQLGEAPVFRDSSNNLVTYYQGSKPTRILAGGDIVNSQGFFVHDDPTDVSMVAAEGQIIFANFTVAGPGTLEVTAGKSIYQGNTASLVSLGAIETGDLRPGADIVVQAGVGAGAPGVGQTDYTGFANRYLDPANLADPGLALAGQPGKVVTTYGDKLTLVDWLRSNYGYTGNDSDAPAFLVTEQATLDAAHAADPTAPRNDLSRDFQKASQLHLVNWLEARYGADTAGRVHYDDTMDPLAFFKTLAPEQQRVFDRNVYYAELTAGGREFNDPDSQRFDSYLRGRDAIAMLFPEQDANGNAIERQGDVTLFQGASNNAGVRTVAGGSIQTLTPGGMIVVGVEGIAPASTSSATPAGLITQGEGDIQMYSQGSILLGLSRIMTTFGGDILGWSAEGDINAGRGSKTTLVYTPPKREYDDYGNVKLSPNVPSTGAGIATLDPIPEVPPGDVDLIAPLGTIDAGEAGIRVSGNVNLAALQVVNAANIQVQGKSVGVPVVAVVNVGALTNASAAAAQATIAAQDVVQRERVAARQALPSIFTVRVLGFGNESLQPEGGTGTSPAPRSGPQPQARQYDMSSMVQIVGLGSGVDPAQASRLTEAERRSLARPDR